MDVEELTPRGTVIVWFVNVTISLLSQPWIFPEIWLVFLKFLLVQVYDC